MRKSFEKVDCQNFVQSRSIKEIIVKWTSANHEKGAIEVIDDDHYDYLPHSTHLVEHFKEGETI